MLRTAPRAALLRLDRHGPRRVIASTGLVAPKRLTVGNGGAYVTDAGGAVLRFSLQ